MKKLLIFSLTCGLVLTFTCRISFGKGEVFKDQKGNIIMEETTESSSSPSNILLTWQILSRAYQSVKQRRLAEADRWIMYAEMKASLPELMKARVDSKYFARCLNEISIREKRGPTAFNSCDSIVLRALLQLRMGDGAEAYQALRRIAKDYPKYGAINQIKARIGMWEQWRAGAERWKVPEKITRWKSDRFPLKVCIASDAVSSSVPYYVKGDGELIRAAFDEWQKQSKGKVKFIFVDDFTKADIGCLWENDPESLGNKDFAGACTRQVDDAPWIGHAVVRILTYRLDKTASGPDKEWRRKYLSEICLHEVGHSLGLEHSPDVNDVMYYMCHKAPLASLTIKDLAALNKLCSFNAEEFLDSANELLFKDPFAALVQYEKALALEPSNVRVREYASSCLYQIAKMDFQSSKYQEAISLLLRARKLWTPSMNLQTRRNVLESLQYAYEKVGQKRDAEEIQKALDADPREEFELSKGSAKR
jgi:tetratricopeptide (TPR) repeat protein